MGNAYVSFVSDTDFVECVKWVCEAYPTGLERIDLEFLVKTSVDPFKMLFDMGNGSFGTKTWIENEKIRQTDKTVNNRIGDFHQMLLGKVDGWENLGVGHTTGVDLKKDDNTIFVELKNKYNTMNSSSQSKCFDKLQDITVKFPKVRAYWAYIVSKDGSSGEKMWEYNRQDEHFKDDRIRVIWGKNVYELVTGNPNSLEETWRALPKAIGKFLDSEMKFNRQDLEIIKKFSRHIFE